MARLYVDGIDEIERALRDMAGGIDGFVDEVLEAGGEIAKRNVEQSIMQHGHFRTGTLLRSKHITYACAYNILNGVMDALTEFSRQLPM